MLLPDRQPPAPLPLLVDDRLRRLQGAATGKDRESTEVDLLLGGEEIVTPRDGITHRLLPRRQVTGASRKQRQALLQALEQRVRREQLDEGCS